MSLTDALPDNGSFSVEVLGATLGFKPNLVAKPTPEEKVEGGEGGEGTDVADVVVGGYVAPACYCRLKLNNVAQCFEQAKADNEGGDEAGDGEVAAADPAVVLSSETCIGDGEGPAFTYNFSVKVASKEKLKVVSSVISDALVNDGGEIEIFKVGGDGEEDEKLGGAPFSLNGAFGGDAIVIKLGEVPTVVEEEKGSAEEAKAETEESEEKKDDSGDSPAATEGGAAEGGQAAEAAPEEPTDKSPGLLAEYGSTSQIEIKVNLGDSIADFIDGGYSIDFSKITANNVPAYVFGVKVAVEDDVDNEGYLVELQEKLAEENKKWSYECILEGLGGDMVVRGGLVEFVKDEEEAPAEGDVGLEQGQGQEEAPSDVAETDGGEEGTAPKPVARPTGKFNLYFAGSSMSSFMTYQEGKALRSTIRAGGDEFTVKLMKKVNPDAVATEEEAAPAKGKKGKKGKGKEEEEVVDEAPAVKNWESSIKVSLGSLVEAGVTECVVQGRFDEDTNLDGTVTITSPLFPENPTGKGGGEERIKAVSGEAYASYEHSLERDMFKELKDQLDVSVDQLVEEFTELFLLNESANTHMGKEEKLKRMLYHLNKNGGYFTLKESLKPCLQRIVAERVKDSDVFTGDGAPRLDSDEGNVYVAKLFDFLLKEMNDSVVRKFVPLSVLECRESRENDIKVAKNIPEKMVKLKMLAEDFEGTGDVDAARRFHMDRIAMAEVETKNEKMGWKYLVGAKVDYADFLLSIQARGEAIACLREAVGLNGKRVDNAMLLACVILEESGEGAGDLLGGCFDLLLPDDENGEGYDEDSFAEVDNAAVLNVLVALNYRQAGQASLMRRAQRTAALAVQKIGGGSPLRHLIVACLDAAEFLLASKLSKCAKVCLEWAEECEAKVKAKCRENGFNDGGVRELRARQAVIKCKICLIEGDLEAAKGFAAEAEKRHKSFGKVERGQVALMASEMFLVAGDDDSALTKLISCLELLPDPVPFKVYYNLYVILSGQGRWKEAREAMFRAAKSWKYSSVWLSIAKASIKLGYLEDAEDSLQESNGANTNDGKSWGLFVVVCLRGGKRLGEANEGLKQALNLGLADLEILREIGDLFGAIDQNTQAEAVWKRGMECAGGAEYYEFGLKLSKCLEAQKEFESALDNYDKVLEEGGEGGTKGRTECEVERKNVLELLGLA
ncbi:hypothetical protein TrCOL_g3823 [Triparma columacea]|uniref:Uncharacterized protein n=1 Tax=Triparma columacea TaxID=722753 RepID=A0A9W7GF35_9STRA|nr:hypothetical protein TrCOL_g3823 [Triparma columacea]